MKDKHNNRLGEIRTESNGKRVAYDRHNNRLGEYDPRTNRTRDKSNNNVGEGDFLASLITDAASAWR